MSQVFVRKAILRGQHVEAVNAFWACTLKPVAELLRMRYCPARWDFGVRYLDRDLPPLVRSGLRLGFRRDLGDLEDKAGEGHSLGHCTAARIGASSELMNIRLQQTAYVGIMSRRS